MAQTSTEVLLRTITVIEAAAFRTGQVVRQILAEHPQLTASTGHAALSATIYSDGEYSANMPRFEVGVDNTAALVWAEALGGDSEWTTRDHGSFVYESTRFTVVIDGVEIAVCGGRSLTDDEAAAWRAAGDQGEGGEG
ncbi:hypothetical protein [Streptomyces longwoodensis]|uniref:hypothetical protein n=1 Tax=Streptomyces longwoodensis TaxID=68231 RepID=UPI00224DFEA1|nr:hypothetical protein [Streptomyces longwoodensis]MCX4993799.1 hypothetical protein [Streptomyces longwoodensis]MCX4998081.1 hypothetical protein [Streptomyces longwoodensis]